jgi:hypothetical protein
VAHCHEQVQSVDAKINASKSQHYIELSDRFMPRPIHHWKNPSIQEKFHSPNIHTDTRFHPASHSLVTESCFPRGKEVGMSGQPLFSIWCQSQELMKLHRHSPYMASWHLWKQLLPHLIIVYYLSIFINRQD